jgi:hypothetical protein
MALFIVGSYKAIPYDPDSAVDPVTHVATEASFIQLLQHGVYDSKYIGYKVQLGNSVDYNNGLWVIADVNHDSENTGQTDCYDLISEDCFHGGVFSSSGNNWRSSDLRTWLNTTFYNGFSENFKSHMNNITYDSNGGTYTDDKIISPSFTEVKGGTSSYAITEGTAYPIFTNGNSRKKYKTGTTSYVDWWTRTPYTTSSNVWIVYSTGGISDAGYLTGKYLAPLMRVH